MAAEMSTGPRSSVFSAREKLLQTSPDALGSERSRVDRPAGGAEARKRAEASERRQAAAAALAAAALRLAPQHPTDAVCSVSRSF